MQKGELPGRDTELESVGFMASYSDTIYKKDGNITDI